MTAMQTRWTYRPRLNDMGKIIGGTYSVLADGKEAGWVMWQFNYDHGVTQWRALDGQHGFIRDFAIVEACNRVRAALTLTPHQIDRNWMDQPPM